MTTTDPTQPTPEPPIHLGGAIPAAEGAAPPATDLATLAQRMSALEARVATLEGGAEASVDDGEDVEEIDVVTSDNEGEQSEGG